MSKKIYLFLPLIIFVLILSGCGKKSSTENNTASDGNNPIQGGAVSSDEEEITSSVLGMMEKGKSLHCTFSFKDEKGAMEQSGDFYVDGQSKKFSSMASATTGTSTIKVNTISDGTYAYTWNSTNEKTGFKMKLDQTTPVKGEESQNTQELNQDIKFKCRSWKVDSSLFALPSGVQFTDMDEMLKKLSQPAVDLCAICAQIPDATQKSACQKTNCK